MSDIRQKIVKLLIKTPLGLTTREIAEDLKMKVQVVNGSLSQMAQSDFIMRGDYIEGEGQIWNVTDSGKMEYGNKIDMKNVEPVPIVEKSSLEQIENESVVEEITATGKKNLPVDSKMEITEIEDFETRAPFSAEKIAAFPVATKIKVNAENKVWQIVDEMGNKIARLLAENKAKQIENIDYKIATLESLADIYNPKISATLREIAADLRG